eukprot:15302599-Ditylum_brightwellii.AAC.2
MDSNYWTREQLCNIPDNPPAFLPSQKVLLKLALKTANVSALDEICAVALTKFEHNARTIRLECETAGFGDQCAEIQPAVRPNVDEHLVRRQLESCFKYDLENGKEVL